MAKKYQEGYDDDYSASKKSHPKKDKKEKTVRTTQNEIDVTVHAADKQKVNSRRENKKRDKDKHDRYED